MGFDCRRRRGVSSPSSSRQTKSDTHAPLPLIILLEVCDLDLTTTYNKHSNYLSPTNVSKLGSSSSSSIA